jgi:hypothetical protein
MPANKTAVLEWVAHLGYSRRILASTIKAYLGHLKSLHVDADLPFDAVDSSVTQRLIRGIKRYFGDRARKPVAPITLDVLRRLVAVSNPGGSLDAANTDAAIKLAFSGFMRSGEFTVKGDKYKAFDPSAHLTRGSVQFLPSIENPSHISVTFPGSKTDPFRKGVTVYIAAVDAPTCAVNALKSLFQTDPRPPNAPLFCNADGSPLQYGTFVARLRTLLTAAGYDASKFSGHSFRRGAASSAAQAGFTEYEIQQLGRWRSDAYKLYIDASRPRLLNLSARLHWAVPAAHPFEPPSLRFAPSLA